MRTKPFALSLFLAVAPVLASAQSHQLVDIGGYRLDIVREGTGSPVIVFEAGLGDSLDTWSPILPAVAKSATVIAYSRAGFGRSDVSPAGRSARQEVKELHELLTRLHVLTPYVLVGRSYGGLLVRLYTSLYAKEVAGLVLVEGTHEQQVKRWGVIDTSYPAAFRRFYDSVLKTMPAGPEAAEVRETVRIQAAAAVEGLTPLPDIPIAVITSMKADAKAVYVNGRPEGHVVWRALHDEWFQRSRNGLHIETTHSGHDTQHEEPQLVTEAIQFVLDRVRGTF